MSARKVFVPRTRGAPPPGSAIKMLQNRMENADVTQRLKQTCTRCCPRPPLLHNDQCSRGIIPWYTWWATQPPPPPPPPPPRVFPTPRFCCVFCYIQSPAPEKKMVKRRRVRNSQTP